jgi:hypothetical protein
MNRPSYMYLSPVGPFIIRPAFNGVELQLGTADKGKPFGSAEEAAEAVADRRTGFAEWDDYEGARAPVSLKYWTPGQ